MKIRSFTFVVASIALLALAAPADAAKNKKNAKADAVLARLDRDQSGAIDGKEAKRAQAMFAALVELDTNKDGKLSDPEIAAAKIPTGTAGEKKKKKQKKSA